MHIHLHFSQMFRRQLVFIPPDFHRCHVTLRNRRNTLHNYWCLYIAGLALRMQASLCAWPIHGRISIFEWSIRHGKSREKTPVLSPSPPSAAGGEGRAFAAPKRLQPRRRGEVAFVFDSKPGGRMNNQRFRYEFLSFDFGVWQMFISFVWEGRCSRSRQAPARGDDRP
jgi:hypothetical protein